MHRCCQNSNSMAGHGSCSCGGSYHHAQSSPFSVLSPDPYSYPNQYSSAPVDCTLSLGTPSTRLSEDADDTGRRFRGSGRERQSPVSNFCWDILQTAKHASPSVAANKASGRSGGDSGGGHDPLLARRCANCDTTSTPLWRNGPRGPKSLCNACGIRFKKEERRATAAAATAAASTGSMMDDAQPMFSHGQYGSWAAAAASHHQKLPCFGTEYSFIDDQARDHSDNGFSFLSWRPSGLVHDFTR